jgi:hypothetical protein
MTGCLVASKIFPKGEPPYMIAAIGEFAFEGSIMSFPVFAREINWPLPSTCSEKNLLE